MSPSWGSERKFGRVRACLNRPARWRQPQRKKSAKSWSVGAYALGRPPEYLGGWSAAIRRPAICQTAENTPELRQYIGLPRVHGPCPGREFLPVTRGNFMENFKIKHFINDDVVEPSGKKSTQIAEKKEKTKMPAKPAGTTKDVKGPIKPCSVRLWHMSESELSDCSLTSLTSEASDRPRRKRSAEGVEADDSEVLAATPSRASTSTAKRGRGRPPTTGEYVGLAKAKAELLKFRKLEEQRAAEDEVSEATKVVLRLREKHRSRVANAGVDVTTMPSPALKEIVSNSLGIVSHEAKASKNLQGRMVGALKVAVDTIQEAVDEMGSRSVSDEVAHLQAANKALEKEIADLRREMTALRQREPATPILPETPDLAEEITSRVLSAVGTMIGARFADIESRLLPATRIRPELAADKRKTASKTSTTTTAVADIHLPSPSPPRAGTPVPEVAAAPSVRPGGEKKSKKQKQKMSRPTMAAKEAAGSRAKQPIQPAQPATSKWQSIGKSGKAKTQKAKASPTSLKKRPKIRVPSAPKTAAVSLTLQPEAEKAGISYMAILTEAKQKIDLASLGIASMTFRKAASGGRILEVSGEDNGTKADLLAAKLRQELPSDEVKVSRPMMRTDVRILGLDDSVTPAEVVEAISNMGGCESTHVRAGRVGLGGAILVSCPVAAAKKVVDAGRVVVGWTTARVMAVTPKTLRCYKCMAPGHFARACKATGADLTGRCFRCGNAGHMARDCEGEPHCAVCAAAGQPSAHAVGGQGCPKRLKAGSRMKRGVGKKPTAPRPSQAADVMDT